METPPRAWGRPRRPATASEREGNTPTGVGKTIGRGSIDNANKKHPHGRGEDHSRSRAGREREETPPRAWGRRSHLRAWIAKNGNTPTGVGKTRQRQQ